MIVISDTSPITNLSAIGCFNLLHSLFDEIHIPRQVMDELHGFGQRWPGADEVEFADWVHVHDVSNVVLLQHFCAIWILAKLPALFLLLT